MTAYRLGNSVLIRATLATATQATVVPAKAGIQEIPRKRTIRLPRLLDSGFRRNDGFMAAIDLVSFPDR